MKIGVGHFATGLVFALLPLSNARSLSYRMKVGEQRACFYAEVDPKVDFSNAVLQFYFAANDVRGTDVVYVDATVVDPSGKTLLNHRKQTHEEMTVKPTIPGAYSLCIEHHGRATEKDLDIDITLPTISVDAAQSSSKESKKLENTVSKLQHELGDLVHLLRYIKKRERRNLETVDSIESWVFYVSLFEVLLIAGMQLSQVVILRTFFSSKKPRV